MAVTKAGPTQIDFGAGLQNESNQLSVDINGLTEQATPGTGDFLMIYDAGLAALRKVDWANLPSSGGGSGEGAKVWINFKGTGAVSIRDSFNVTSITDNGTGDYTVTFDTDFATTNYAALATIDAGIANSVTILEGPTVIAVGSFRFVTSNSGNAADRDSEFCWLAFFGDQ